MQISKVLFSEKERKKVYIIYAENKDLPKNWIQKDKQVNLSDNKCCKVYV